MVRGGATRLVWSSLRASRECGLRRRPTRLPVVYASSGNNSSSGLYDSIPVPCAVPTYVLSRLSEPAQKVIQRMNEWPNKLPEAPDMRNEKARCLHQAF